MLFLFWGMLLVSFLAGWVNFSHFYDGRGNPSQLNILMTALVIVFWIVYLVINHRSRGYLICSLCLTVGLLIVFALALALNTIGLPAVLETILLLLVVLFVSPRHGITGFSGTWLLPVCGALLLLWLGLQVHFLWRTRHVEERRIP